MNLSRRHFHKRLAAAALLPSVSGRLFAESKGETLWNAPAPEITADEMDAVYQEVKTPYKYGIVMPQEEGDLIDSGKVYRKDGAWFISYLRMERGIGYVSRLARSDNLIDWEPLGTTMPFRETGWDAWQASPSPALIDYDWGGDYEIRPFDGKYWFTYIGGAGKGYEPDPLKIGIAWTDDPTSAKEFHRFPNPIMTPDDPEARDFEKKTLYQTNVIRVDENRFGDPFVCFYNGKDIHGVERIGMAVSDDLLHWRRLGNGPVIDHGGGISGDPQIARIGGLWVMFYFGAFWKPKAFDTFAVSKDLIHWTKWNGPHLTEPSEDYDAQFAHKPCVIKHDGVVFHYYCAVGNQGRCLALAASQKL